MIPHRQGLRSTVQMEVGRSGTCHTTLTTHRTDFEVEPLSNAASSTLSTHPRLTLRLGPRSDQARNVPVEDTERLHPPALGPTAEHSPNVQGHGTTPPDAAPHNLRLEQAKAILDKKRKSEGVVSIASAKKQKSTPPSLATPDDKNTIR